MSVDYKLVTYRLMAAAAAAAAEAAEAAAAPVKAVVTVLYRGAAPRAGAVGVAVAMVLVALGVLELVVVTGQKSKTNTERLKCTQYDRLIAAVQLVQLVHHRNHNRCRAIRWFNRHDQQHR